MQEIQTADKNARIIYINKEDLLFSHISTTENLNDFVQQQKKCGQKNYIFIEEIQERCERCNFESNSRNLGTTRSAICFQLKISGFLKSQATMIKISGLNSQEIDFVAEKNGERIYIQAMLTINEEKTLKREFVNLLKI